MTTVVCICSECGIKFLKSLKKYNESIKKRRQLFCSYKCYIDNIRTGKTIKCAECGHSFYRAACCICERNFCSNSCAAKFNNIRKPPMSYETRAKISYSLTGKTVKIDWSCSKCGRKISRGAKNCATHREQTVPPPDGGVALYPYEKPLMKILEREFGTLRKGRLLGQAVDFLNDRVAIDFSFDYGKGTSNIIKRMRVLKANKVDQELIVYIPLNKVGGERKKELVALCREVRDSNKYRFLLSADSSAR